MSLSSRTRAAIPRSSFASIANTPILNLGRDSSRRVVRPTLVAFFKNHGRMIVAQARASHACAARAFGAVPHPVTRPGGRVLGGEDVAVQAKGRLGDRRQPRGRARITKVGLD